MVDEWMFRVLGDALVVVAWVMRVGVAGVYFARSDGEWANGVFYCLYVGSMWALCYGVHFIESYIDPYLINI